MKCRSLAESFSHAFDGVIHTIRNERNMKIHMAATVIVIIAGAVFKISAVEFSMVFLAIGLVLVGEVVNTAIETVVDMVAREYSEEAKVAKDVAAGASFIAAIIAVLVGINVFGWRFFEWIKQLW